MKISKPKYMYHDWLQPAICAFTQSYVLGHPIMIRRSWF